MNVQVRDRFTRLWPIIYYQPKVGDAMLISEFCSRQKQICKNITFVVFNFGDSLYFMFRDYQNVDWGLWVDVFYYDGMLIFE